MPCPSHDDNMYFSNCWWWATKAQTVGAMVQPSFARLLPIMAPLVPPDGTSQASGLHGPRDLVRWQELACWLVSRFLRPRWRLVMPLLGHDLEADNFVVVKVHLGTFSLLGGARLIAPLSFVATFYLPHPRLLARVTENQKLAKGCRQVEGRPHNSVSSGSSLKGMKMSWKKAVATPSRWVVSFPSLSRCEKGKRTADAFPRLICDSRKDDLPLKWPEYHHSELDCDV
jgi:hypothetical protein